MSEATEEAVVLNLGTDAAFSQLLDALAPEPEDGTPGAPAAAGDSPVGPAADAAVGAAAAGGAAAGAAGPADAGAGAVPGADVPNAGAGQPSGSGDAVVPADAGDQPAGGGSPASDAADRPGAGTLDAAVLAPKLGELSTALEERTLQAHQAEALKEVQTEHKAYFEAIETHPRLMVGREVPAIGKEGMEVLRDENDAKSWQEAAKALLVSEIRSRAEKSMGEQSDFLTTVHRSIDLFKDNPDLIPGTKGFDVDLANQLVDLLEPFELRVDEKLQGYSIDVQPLVNKLRAKLVAERAAATSSAATPPAAPATPPAGAAAATPPAGAPASPTDAPQAGITSKAGAGAEDSDDFSALFGTLGLPGLRI